jgi:hypothetical protein
LPKTKNYPYRSFSLDFTGRAKELKTPISICRGFDPNKTPKSIQPKLQSFTALWDTGCSNVAISQNVIDKCNLKPTGMVKVFSAKGAYFAETFLINVMLPQKVGVSEVTATKANISGFDVLIGMSIITHGDFAITNKEGKTLFSFRIPSKDYILFENEKTIIRKPPITKETFIGRNDPCPCGSGKKYKNCCGKK